VDSGSLVVCPADAGKNGLPDFDEKSCHKVAPGEIDPQGRMIWVRAHVVLPEAMLTDPRPLGLSVYGKGAREVYLNGRYLGAEGRPAAAKADETAGRMDSAFHVPRELVRSGRNEVVLRMSDHHGFLYIV